LEIEREIVKRLKDRTNESGRGIFKNIHLHGYLCTELMGGGDQKIENCNFSC
jgi:hypothetical protein